MTQRIQTESSIHPSTYPWQGRGGAGANPSWHWASGGVHPWTGRQSVTGPTYRDRQPLTFTPTGNSESPIHLHLQNLWIVGGSWSTQRKPTQARGEHANSTLKGPSRPVGSNPEPSCCEVTVLATAPPCRPQTETWDIQILKVSKFHYLLISTGVIKMHKLYDLYVCTSTSNAHGRVSWVTTVVSCSQAHQCVCVCVCVCVCGGRSRWAGTCWTRRCPLCCRTECWPAPVSAAECRSRWYSRDNPADTGRHDVSHQSWNLFFNKCFHLKVFSSPKHRPDIEDCYGNWIEVEWANKPADILAGDSRGQMLLIMLHPVAIRH